MNAAERQACITRMRAYDPTRCVEVRRATSSTPDWRVTLNCAGGFVEEGVFHLHEATAMGIEMSKRLGVFLRCPFTCSCCHGAAESFMLQDTLWARLGTPRGFGFVCWDCVEAILNRPLFKEDFRDVPLNSVIFKAWERGRLFGTP